MDKMYKSVILLVVASIKISHGFSDIGVWDLPLNGENCVYTLEKSLFKDTKLFIQLQCGVTEPTNLTIEYRVTHTLCSPDYMHYYEQEVVQCSKVPFVWTEPNSTLGLVASATMQRTCHGRETKTIDEPAVAAPPKGVDGGDVLAVAPKRRAPLLKVEHEGVYLLHMTVQSKVQFNGSVHVEMVAPSGYLSAALWPLLPFFGAMCGVYAALCTAWLAVCALQWRDLLRIQYWIGGVALLGMLESATYYGLYSAINRSGYFNVNVYMCAMCVSICKRSLARMLVIIVSLGFGIVRPRLGPALQRVLAAGGAWGLLAALNGWLRLHHRAADSNRDLLLSEVPLSLLDSAICWWVFVSLAHTQRTLQLRRNTVKLSLYRHFTNTLIFAVISSVVFMLYSIKSYRVLNCITEWKEVWMDEAYWHVLFASVLAAIMVLWRPTNNNQRYAFTPLLDNAEDDDEEEEQFVNDAYGVKMRNSSLNADPGGEGKDSGPPEPNSNSLDSDLRWVEENIPTSSLPLLDSDEEIINTKFEVSKMQ